MCNLEKNNVQRLLLAEYQKTGAPMQTVQTTQSKHFELEMMGSEFAKGLWNLPMADQFSRARVQPLIDELRSYPTGRFSDTVEALRLAWLLATEEPKGAGMNVSWITF